MNSSALKVIIGLACILVGAGSCQDRSSDFVKMKSPEATVKLMKDFEKYCEGFSDNIDYQTYSAFASIYGEYSESLEITSEFKDVDPDLPIYFGNEDNKQKNISELSSQEAELLVQRIEDSLSIATERGDEEKSTEMQFILNLLKQSSEDSSIFANSQFVNAKEYITSVCARYNYLLINEAHYCSQHRQFTADLLEGLYENGYRYLALEALAWKDSMINDRAFPFLESGFYTRDAVFGNLIRKARALGYILVPYEIRESDHENREYAQAKNIVDQTSIHSGKTLIHAGYGHITECCLDDSFVAMGTYLKDMVGEDILTIDQIEMSEVLDTLKESKYYSEFRRMGGFPDVMIPLTGNKTPHLSPLGLSTVDIQVYHPPTKFVHGRPDWFIKDKTFITLPKEILQMKGKLLSVIKKGEPKEAVAVDQFVIDDEKQLLLHPGQYVARIIDCKGEILLNYSLKI